MFFVTAFLGEPHGSAKSARDFARALPAVHGDVNIVSPFCEDFGTAVSGYRIPSPFWHEYPRERVPLSWWRRVPPAARDALKRIRIRRAMNNEVVIVNGWASIDYWKELAVKSYRESVVIVRESPRHFDEDDPRHAAPEARGRLDTAEGWLSLRPPTPPRAATDPARHSVLGGWRRVDLGRAGTGPRRLRRAVF